MVDDPLPADDPDFLTVPRYPTDAMLRRGVEAMGTYHGGMRNAVAAIWRAMVEAREEGLPEIPTTDEAPEQPR